MAELRVLDSDPPVAASVIEHLEMLLDRARNDELSAVAIAIVYRDGTTDQHHSEQHNLATMAGSVAALHTKLIRRILDSDE